MASGSRKLSDYFRRNARQRGYSAEWDKKASAYLEAHPVCVGCRGIGLVVPATVVDHIIPHKGDRRLFWDSNNWQGLCTWHHNSIKPELERRFHGKQIPAAQLFCDSATGKELTRARYRPAVGADGYATPASSPR